MKLAELVSRMELRNFTPALCQALQAEVGQAMACDLPSDVLAHAPCGALLVTAQSNLNIIAIAARRRLPAVLLTCGVLPTEAMPRRACEEGVLLLGTDLPSFEVAGRLYGLGLRGGAR